MFDPSDGRRSQAVELLLGTLWCVHLDMSSNSASCVLKRLPCYFPPVNLIKIRFCCCLCLVLDCAIVYERLWCHFKSYIGSQDATCYWYQFRRLVQRCSQFVCHTVAIYKQQLWWCISQNGGDHWWDMQRMRWDVVKAYLTESRRLRWALKNMLELLYSN